MKQPIRSEINNGNNACDNSFMILINGFALIASVGISDCLSCES